MNARRRESDDADVDSGRGIGGGDESRSENEKSKTENLHIKCVAVKGITGFGCVYVVNLTGMEPIIENGLDLFKYSGEGGRKKLCSGQNERRSKNRSEKTVLPLYNVQWGFVEVIMNKWKL